jgi:hypothetical protein
VYSITPIKYKSWFKVLSWDSKLSKALNKVKPDKS